MDLEACYAATEDVSCEVEGRGKAARHSGVRWEEKEFGWKNLEAGHATAEDVSCKAEGRGKAARHDGVRWGRGRNCGGRIKGKYSRGVLHPVGRHML